MQVVSDPTHTSPMGTSSLIDLVMISNPSMLSACIVIPPLGSSDHNGVQLSLKWRSNNTARTKPRKIWRYNQANYELANSMLADIDWEHVLQQSDDVNELWRKWKDTFMSVMQQCIPQTTLPDKRNLPWLNRELTKHMRARNLAFKRAKHSNLTKHWNQYKKVRNNVANKLKSAKKKFFTRLRPSNSKSFWKTVKVLTKVDSRIPVLKNDRGAPITDDTTKASILNNFFSECFNTSVPPLTVA